MSLEDMARREQGINPAPTGWRIGDRGGFVPDELARAERTYTITITERERDAGIDVSMGDKGKDTPPGRLCAKLRETMERGT